MTTIRLRMVVRWQARWWRLRTVRSRRREAREWSATLPDRVERMKADILDELSRAT